MDRSQKEKLVASLQQALSETACVVITHQTGMTVEEVTELRRQMRAAGASFKVTKNRLARRALAGTKFEALRRCSPDPPRSRFRGTRWPRRRWPSSSPSKNDKFGSWAEASTISSSTPQGSSPWPPCRRSTSCVQSCSACCRPRRRVSPRVLQAPGGQIARVLPCLCEEGRGRLTAVFKSRNQVPGVQTSWLILTNWSTSSRR